ncbi:MAG: S-layer homology domain-containing protein [Candidatus Margulisiibacteriota bacterium]
MKRIFLLVLLLTIFTITAIAAPVLLQSSLADKAEINSKKITISGICKGADAVFINDQKVNMIENKFSMNYDLGDPGKKTIFITLFDNDGNSHQSRFRLLFLKKYQDLAKNKLQQLIQDLATLGYFPEAYGSNFNPDKVVSDNDSTKKNIEILPYAVENQMERERFAVLLFNNARVKQEIINLLNWQTEYPDKLNITWRSDKKPVALVQEKEEIVIKPADKKEKEITIAKLPQTEKKAELEKTPVIVAKKAELTPKKQIPEINNLQVFLPQDTSITKKENCFVKGKIMNKTGYVLVNGRKIYTDKTGIFGEEVPINIGKNLITISLNGQSEKPVVRRVLRLVDYSDVPEGHWSSRIISYIGTLGYFSYIDKFNPEYSIIKEEMAVIVSKMKNIELPKLNSAPFRDVPADYWAAPYIKLVTDEKLLGVYPDSKFRPKEELTRYQALVILSRIEGLNLNNVEVRKEFPFKDVNKDSALARLLQVALDADLISAAPQFNGNGKLTRTALASLLSKVSIVKNQLEDLLDWQKGYN